MKDHDELKRLSLRNIYPSLRKSIELGISSACTDVQTADARRAVDTLINQAERAEATILMLAGDRDACHTRIERLEAALREIAALHPGDGHCEIIARAALESEK